MYEDCGIVDHIILNLFIYLYLHSNACLSKISFKTMYIHNCSLHMQMSFSYLSKHKDNKPIHVRTFKKVS